MEKIEKNNKDLEKSGGVTAVTSRVRPGCMKDNDADPKDKVLGSSKNEQPQSGISIGILPTRL